MPGRRTAFAAAGFVDSRECTGHDGCAKPVAAPRRPALRCRPDARRPWQKPVSPGNDSAPTAEARIHGLAVRTAGNPPRSDRAAEVAGVPFDKAGTAFYTEIVETNGNSGPGRRLHDLHADSSPGDQMPFGRA